jgi:hypothetical protein
MYEKVEVLHRDISYKNILIHDDKKQKLGDRHGLLIDYDYGATTTREVADNPEGHTNARSVCAPSATLISAGH